MALVRNETNHAITLDPGPSIGPGETANVDLGLELNADLLAEGRIRVTDGAVSPPAPDGKRATVRAIVQDDAASDVFTIDVSAANPVAPVPLGTDGLPWDASTLASDTELAAAVAAVGGRFRGAYASGTAYKAKDLVTQAGSLYSRNADGTPSGAFVGGEWTQVTAGSSGGSLSAWAASHAYSVGDQVTYQGSIWTVATAHTSGSTFEASKFTYTAGKKYDAKAGVYNATESSLFKWRKAVALSRGGTRAAKIVSIGDSLTNGQNATNYITDRFPQLLTRLLNAQIPGGRNFVSHYRTDIGSAGSPLSKTGTFITATGDLTAAMGGGTLSTLALSAVQADRFYVFYQASGSTTVTAKIDGSSVGTFNSGTGNAVSVQTFTTTSGLHTFDVSLTTGTFTVLGLGYADGDPSTGGVRTWVAGIGGTTADYWAATGASASLMAQLLDANTPDLTTIQFGINDWTQQKSISLYETSMTTLVQRAQINGDVVMIGPLPYTGADLTIPFDSYYDALYRVADAQNCVLVDMRKRWVSRTISASFFTDAYHPTTVGHWEMAKAVYDAVTPVAGSTPAPQRVVQGGALGAAYTLALLPTDRDVLLTGTLSANCTITVTGITPGVSITCHLQQDATGSRTLTFSPLPKTPSGAALGISTAANAIDVVTLYSPDGTGLCALLAGKAMA